MIKIKSDDLLFGLSFVKKIAPGDTNMPMWKFVKVECKGNTITFSGKDQDKHGAITLPLDADVDDISFIVPLDEFHQTVASYQKASENIAIKVRKDKDIVVYDESNGSVVFPQGRVDDFPLILNTDEVGAKIVPSEIVTLLKLGQYTDLNSDRLSKVHLVADGETLYAEATNQYVGGRGEVELSLPLTLDIAISGKIEPLLKYMQSIDETWEIVLPKGQNILYIKGEYWFAGVSLLAEPYPSLARIFSNSDVNRLELDKKETKQKINNVSANVENNRIKIEIKDGVVKFVGNYGHGHSLEKLYEDQQDNFITLSLYNLNKIISSVKGDTLYIQIGTPYEPFIVYDNNITYFALSFGKN